MSEKLLIIEDDKKLNDGIRLALKNDAYFFYQCRTLQEAREILKKGYIKVTSKRGKGSTFSVFLPIAKKE